MAAGLASSRDPPELAGLLLLEPTKNKAEWGSSDVLAEQHTLAPVDDEPVGVPAVHRLSSRSGSSETSGTRAAS